MRAWEGKKEGRSGEKNEEKEEQREKVLDSYKAGANGTNTSFE